MFSKTAIETFERATNILAVRHATAMKEAVQDIGTSVQNFAEAITDQPVSAEISKGRFVIDAEVTPREGDLITNFMHRQYAKAKNGQSIKESRR